MPKQRRTVTSSRLILPFLGAAALLWFLVRVIPKPSRAAYPCQRAAAPFAAGFLAWLLLPLLASRLWRSGVDRFRSSSKAKAIPILAASLALPALAVLFVPSDRNALADPPVPNQPIGEAKGIHPGRVVWVHDPAATDWLGPGNGHWWEPEHTSQSAVDAMLFRALRELAGAATDSAAWDAIFRHFNAARGKGDVGYAPGEKIAIKVNFVGCHYLWGGVDPVGYDLVSKMDYPNTSPQMIRALVAQLVDEAGVLPEDIAVGDPLALYPNQYHDPIAAEFPGLVFLDHDGGTAEHPRTPAEHSDVPFHWSDHPEGVLPDYVPRSNAEAEYFISLGNFKSHRTAGVTLAAKNLYGSLFRVPDQSGYADMHATLPWNAPATGSYRALVDLAGHAHLGGKALLWMIDALYPGVHNDDIVPRRWDFPPFSGDWTSSLFLSQDPVALESVGFDFMQQEGDPRSYPQMPGADDYLTEAALADNPPSGTFYDPDHEGDVERLPSLGVHEHWSDPVAMAYSRNLGTGPGIEFIRVSLPSVGVASGDRAAPFPLEIRPNPFREEATIRFVLPGVAGASGTVYDVRGRLVRELEFPPGGARREGSLVWDGRDGGGREAAAGLYFVRIRAGEREEVRRVVRVR